MPLPISLTLLAAAVIFAITGVADIAEGFAVAAVVNEGFRAFLLTQDSRPSEPGVRQRTPYRGPEE